MAGIEIRRNRESWHPAWAKDIATRDHIIPGGAKLDPTAFAREASTTVTTTGSSPTNEVQNITISGTPTGGTYTLTFAGQTTAPIAYNANAAAVQAALRALENIPDGAGVAVTSSAPFVVTFTGDFAAEDVAQLSANGSGLTGGTNPAVAVTTATPGQTGSTTLGAETLPVSALGRAIDAGTQLLFTNNRAAYVKEAAAQGATSIVVYPLEFEIPTGSVAYVPGSGKAYVRDGILVGRTYAEETANAPFGPADDADDVVYLIYHPVDDITRNNDVELYRRGGLVDLNALPAFSTLSSALQAKIRSTYETMRGID